MRQIRYEAMIVGGSSQCSILRLSDYESRHEKSQNTETLAEEMLDRSMNWIIDGVEVFSQVSALWELVRYLRSKNNDVFIHLKTHNYNYSSISQNLSIASSFPTRATPFHKNPYYNIVPQSAIPVNKVCGFFLKGNKSKEGGKRAFDLLYT